MSSADGLARLDLTPRPVNPALAIAAAVLQAAEDWVVYGEGPHLRCRGCGQSVVTTGTLTLGVLSTAVLAHLMQRHGWTREAVANV
jgi:hypothetical protein